MTDGGIVSAWITLPIGAALMAIIAWHSAWIDASDEPVSRKRIRIMNGWVMLVGIPLLAAGFSLIDPDAKPRLFAMVWLGASALLLISVALAIADAVNTIRLAAAARRRLAERLTGRRADADGESAGAR